MTPFNARKRRFTTHSSSSSWTRRGFLQSTIGSVLALGLASCDNVSDPVDEPFDGPEIDEADFIGINEGYYNTGIDTKTQLPHSFIAGGEPSGETDPVSIAYRLQYLIDQGSSASGTIETMLDHLLAAQINEFPPRNYRNLLPTLRFTDTEAGTEPARREYSVMDNAMLSARVAMAAQAFKGTAIATKAMAYLDNQKEGYNDLLARNNNAFFPTFVDAGIRGVDGAAYSLVFGGYYEGAAFALSYFVGDTAAISDRQVGLDVWQAMINTQNTLINQHAASTTGSLQIPSPLSRNGSGFQYFHPLLAVDTSVLSPSMANALYNVLYSYLDAAVFDRLPGIYSAGPNLNGNFLEDNGLNRLAARERFQGSQEKMVTIDALATALRLFPESSRERRTLRAWIGLYGSLSGIRSLNGYYSSIDKNGQIAQSLFARQNAAMILLSSTAADHLDAFLIDQGRPGMQAMFSQIELMHQGSPIERIDTDLPTPPDFGLLFT